MPHIHSLLYILLLSLAAAPRAAAQIGEPRDNIAVGVSAGVAMNTIGFSIRMHYTLLSEKNQVTIL